MSSILPPAAASLPPAAGDNLLAQYLRPLLKSASTGIHYDQVPSIMQGLLAIATLQRFDPNLRITYTHHNDQQRSHSLLEAVLLLNNANRPSAIQRWPATLEGFGPHLAPTDRLGRKVGVDAQWAAAVFTAAGCNPWLDLDLKQKRVPVEVYLAVHQGFGSLVDRFLDCPGAPDAQWLATAKVADNRRLLAFAAQSNDGLSTVKALVDRGARVPEKEALEVLSSATFEAVQILAPAVPDLPAPIKAKILAAWKERSGKDLTPVQVEQMQVLTLREVAAGMSSTALAVARHLRAEWGAAPNGSRSQAYDFSLDDDAEVAASVAQVKGGPQAGQWSVFAAAVASRIRQANSQGALGWSTPLMLHRHFDEQQRKWVVADCAQPPYKGSLKSALGFDWRPGVAIDGVVALALIGQRGASPYSSSAMMEKNEEEVAADIRQFALAAGIDDIEAWARSYGPAAADFTIHVLKSPKVNAARCFLSTWSTGLSRRPALAASLSAEQRLDLLQSLTAHFQLSVGWGASSAMSEEAKKFMGIAQVLFPGLAHTSFATTGLSEVENSAALLLSLVRNQASDKVPEKLDELEQASPALSERNFNILSRWIAAKTLSGDEQKAAQAFVERWRLHQDTAPAASIRSGMRL